jgi:hypothetical protein
MKKKKKKEEKTYYVWLVAITTSILMEVTTGFSALCAKYSPM